MTTQHADQEARMAAAAAIRTAPGAPPAGTAAVRSKPYRISLDLSPQDYRDLKRWIASVTTTIDPHDPSRISHAKALRAMLHATIRDPVISAVVVGLLREERQPS